MSERALLQYPMNMDNDAKYPAKIEFHVWERKTSSSSTPKQAISLYMPERLSNPNTVGWDFERIGMMGTVFSGGDANLNARDVIDKLTSSGLAKVAGLGGGNVTADQIQGVSTGKLRNPYLTALFRGVDFRTFEFVFKFAPHDERDCERIKEIINTFRINSLPQGSGRDNNAFLSYPNEFEIKYKFLNGDNKWLPKFRRCVLTAIDTDFTGAGMWAMMRNGFPAEINLTLRFSEIEMILSKDVEEGY